MIFSILHTKFMSFEVSISLLSFFLTAISEHLPVKNYHHVNFQVFSPDSFKEIVLLQRLSL